MVSAVWIYVIAFLEDTTQYSEFLRCLLLPGYILFFVYQSISETWKPLLIAIVAGFFLLITLAYKSKSEKGGVFNPPESTRTSETRFVAR